jgi:hypothetical protein
MRRDSSTVLVLTGEVRPGLLAEVGRSPNVSVVRPAASEEGGLDAAVSTLREASRRASTYVLAVADPLAEVAAEWQAMWDLSRQSRGGAEFENRAHEVLLAWRAGRFELPDYYLVLARAEAEGGAAAFHLGPLRAARPHRVAAVAAGNGREQAAAVRQTLGSLRHGPWWPPLDELVDTARRFFAGSLTAGEGTGVTRTVADANPMGIPSSWS